MATPDDDALLRDEPAPGVVRLTFNRPDALNAISMPMVEQLLGHLDEIRNDLDHRVVILTGNGRAFTSGVDVRDRTWPSGIDSKGSTMHQRSVLAHGLYGRLPTALRALPQPVICGVNGLTTGVGLALVASSDLVVATEDAWFSNVFHNIGQPGTELGLAFLLQRSMGTQRAAELLFTSRRISAAKAQAIGFVLDVVPGEGLPDACLELARDVMAATPYAAWMTKLTSWSARESGSLQGSMDLDATALLLAGTTKDAQEKMTSVHEKRPPSFGLR